MEKETHMEPSPHRPNNPRHQYAAFTPRGIAFDRTDRLFDSGKCSHTAGYTSYAALSLSTRHLRPACARRALHVYPIARIVVLCI
jgi:hypothetical protein